MASFTCFLKIFFSRIKEAQEIKMYNIVKATLIRFCMVMRFTVAVAVHFFK